MLIPVINESRPLEKGYHYLPIFNATCLIALNNFVLNNDSQSNKFVMSYTRYLQSIPTYSFAPSSIIIRLKLNIEKISNNFEIKPFNNEKRYRYKPNLPSKINTEAEERIYSKNRNIENFNSFIEEAQILDLTYEDDKFRLVNINSNLSKLLPNKLTPRKLCNYCLENQIAFSATGRLINWQELLPKYIEDKDTKNKEKEKKRKQKIELKRNQMENIINNVISKVTNFEKFIKLVKDNNIPISTYSRIKESKSLIYYSPNYNLYNFKLSIKDSSIYFIANHSNYTSNFILADSDNKAIKIFKEFNNDNSNSAKIGNILNKIKIFPNLILDSNDSPEKIDSFKTFVQNNHLPFKVISDKYVIKGSSTPVWNPHSIELSINKWN